MIYLIIYLLKILDCRWEKERDTPWSKAVLKWKIDVELTVWQTFCIFEHSLWLHKPFWMCETIVTCNSTAKRKHYCEYCHKRPALQKQFHLIRQNPITPTAKEWCKLWKDLQLNPIVHIMPENMKFMHFNSRSHLLSYICN